MLKKFFQVSRNAIDLVQRYLRVDAGIGVSLSLSGWQLAKNSLWGLPITILCGLVGDFSVFLSRLYGGYRIQPRFRRLKYDQLPQSSPLCFLTLRSHAPSQRVVCRGKRLFRRFSQRRARQERETAALRSSDAGLR